MPILSIFTQLAGTPGVSPSIAYISTSDSISILTTDGYLTKAVAEGASFSLPCMACVSSITAIGEKPKVGWYQVAEESGAYSLIRPSSAVSAAVPTSVNHIATYFDDAGNIGDNPTGAYSFGSIEAGGEGVSGGFLSRDGAAGSGKLVLNATANTADAIVTITNKPTAISTVYSIPSVGTATGGLVSSPTPYTLSANNGSFVGGTTTFTIVDALSNTTSVAFVRLLTQTNIGIIVSATPVLGGIDIVTDVDLGNITYSYLLINVG
jgi:hypothetical protein